jgi:hypothetical protein
MESAMQQRLGRAMQDVWERLARTMQHFHTKVADEEAIFRDSTVRNLTEIVDILPSLNILDDPNLERIRQDLRNTLCGYEANDLRNDLETRKHAASEAQRIMDEMAGYMKAFEGMQA